MEDGDEWMVWAEEEAFHMPKNDKYNKHLNINGGPTDKPSFRRSLSPLNLNRNDSTLCFRLEIHHPHHQAVRAPSPESHSIPRARRSRVTTTCLVAAVLSCYKQESN